MRTVDYILLSATRVGWQEGEEPALHCQVR